MENAKFYVYMHINKPNNKKYIGITGRSCEDRWCNGKGYSNQVFGKAIEKYGWENFDHEILEIVNTREKACELEKYYIQKYNSHLKEYGYNISLGGDYGLLGLYNLPSISTPVYQYDLDGNFLNEYPSMMEAERQTGIDNSLICACCKGKNKYTKNYIWSYEKYNKIKGIDVKSYRYDAIEKACAKKVFQYDLNGNFIRQYDSVSKASLESGVSLNQISKCCLMDIHSSGGYMWSYNYLLHMESYKDRTTSYNKGLKEIYKYNLAGNLICVYENISDAANDFNTTELYLNRKCNETKNNFSVFKNYIFSYEKLSLSFFEKGKELYSLNEELNYVKIQNSKYDNTKIFQYSLDGVFIKEYKGIKDIKSQLNFSRVEIGNIIACCNNKYKTSNGYQWSFEKHDKIFPVKKLLTQKPFYRLDRNGNILDEYKDIDEVYLDYNNISEEKIKNNILNCLQGRMKTYDNCIWVFKENIDTLDLKQHEPSSKAIKINQYDLNENYIRSFDSIAKAGEFLNIKNTSHISSCCRNKRKTAYGYKWKYAA